MELTEQMVAYVAQEGAGSRVINYGGHEIDLTPPWRRLTMREAILERSGVDIDARYPDAASLP